MLRLQSLFGRLALILVILPLAIAGGASTAFVSLREAVLNPLPELPSAERSFVAATMSEDQQVTELLDWGSFDALRARLALIGTASAAEGMSLDGLSLDDGPLQRPVTAVTVSSGYFASLGTKPVLGRDFNHSDESSEPLATVLSHAVWRSLGGDPQIVGRNLRVSGHLVQVIGVGPIGFRGTQLGRSDDLWVPLQAAESIGGWHRSDLFRPHSTGTTYRFRWLRTIVRLDTAQNSNPVKAAASSILSDTVLVPLTTAAISRASRPEFQRLATLARWLTGTLLVIACGTLVSLQVAALPAIHRDLQLRRALGAPLRKIVTLLARDLVWMKLPALTVSVLLSWLLLKLLPVYVFPNRTGAASVELTLDWALPLAVGVAAISYVVVALLPIWLGGRIQDSQWVSPRFGRLRSLIIVAQVAFTVLLIVPALLFSRDLYRAFHAPLGFDHQTIFLSINPDSTRRYSAPARQLAARETVEALKAIPGVAEATFGRTIFGPAVGMTTPIIWTEGVRRTLSSSYLLRCVGPSYLATVGATLAVGREIDTSDILGAPMVAVVTTSLARELWGTPEQALSGSLRLDPKGPDFRVVGVVHDMVREGVKLPVRPTVFVAAAQTPTSWRQLDFVVRASADPPALVPNLEARIRDILPASAVETTIGTSLIAAEVQQQRIAAAVAIGLGTTAVGLCFLGVWTVVVCVISHRKTEIGIRMAIGASSGAIVRQFGWYGALPAIVGCALGSIAWVLVRGQLTPYMFVLSPTDLWSVVAGTNIILFVAIGAAYVAATGAVTVTPADLLRRH
jgi:predicted permease